MDWEESRKIIKRFKMTAKRNRLESRFFNDMQSLFLSENFSDISLHCGSEVFRVHKNILSARSPVFAAMFMSPMKESQQDYVEITGIEPHTLRSLLSYIYCCRTERCMDVTLASELLSAANMYQILDLKHVCIKFLKYIMCQENVLDILRVADLFDNDLRKDAIKFISTNYEVIEELSDWKQLQKDLPHIVIEIMASKIDALRCNDKNKRSNPADQDVLIIGLKRKNDE